MSSELLLGSIPSMSRAAHTASMRDRPSHLVQRQRSPRWWHTTREPVQTTPIPLTAQAALSEGGEVLD